MSLIEIAQLAGIFGVGPVALYKGMEKAIDYKINGKIDNLRDDVSELSAEMTRRFDRMDFRVTEFEQDLDDLQAIVSHIRTDNLDRERRLGRMEGLRDQEKL